MGEVHAAYNFTRRNVSLLQFPCAFVFSESNVPSYFSGAICIAIIRAELFIPFLSPLCYLLAFFPLGLRPAFILSLNPGPVLRERCHGLSKPPCQASSRCNDRSSLEPLPAKRDHPTHVCYGNPFVTNGLSKEGVSKLKLEVVFFFFFLSVSHSEGKKIEQFPSKLQVAILF